MSSCRKKLHENSSKKGCLMETTSFLQVYTVIKVVTQNFSNRYLNKQRKYLEEFSSRLCVIKLDSIPPVVFFDRPGHFSFNV